MAGSLVKAAIEGDLIAYLRSEHDDLADGAKRAATRAGLGLQAELRRQVTSTGLGQRVANAWRLEVFPTGNRGSLRSAAVVKSKASKIIHAFNDATPIRGTHGNWLAIPTDNVPNKRGFRGSTKPMTPVEVEEYLNADLHFVPLRNGNGLLVARAIRAKSGRGFRPATKGRLRQGRAAEQVVMFILVRQVRLAKRLDVEGATDRWTENFYQFLVEELGTS